MPSTAATRDVSLLWLICSLCEGRHNPKAGCPRPGIWLVASICRQCTQARYCRDHDCHLR